MNRLPKRTQPSIGSFSMKTMIRRWKIVIYHWWNILHWAPIPIRLIHPCRSPFRLDCRPEGRIGVYNLLGQEVWGTGNELWPSGQHHVHWSGNTTQGQAVSSGIYFVTWRGNHFTRTMKVILIR